MQAGSLNRWITIQQRTQVPDASGQITDVWQDVISCYANITGQTGMGSLRQGRSDGGIVSSITRYSVRIRYRPTVDSSMRVMYQGVPMDITLVNHDLSGHEYTDLVCGVGGNDG